MTSSMCTIRFQASMDTRKLCQRRGVPFAVLDLLENLLHIDPEQRPNINKVMRMWAAIKVVSLLEFGCVVVLIDKSTGGDSKPISISWHH
jgi:sugar phosphate isomerase/epimerase